MACSKPSLHYVVPQCGQVDTVLTAPVDGEYTFTFDHLGAVHVYTQSRLQGEVLILEGTSFNERARVTGCFTDSNGEKISDENGVSEIFVEVKSFAE